MNDRRKTKNQLIEELQDLRQQLEACRAEATARADEPALPVERLASSGMWVVDTDFVVRIANDSMCRLVHRPPDEVVGHKCYELMHGPACHTSQCAMRRAFARGASVSTRETRHVGQVALDCRVLAHVVRGQDQEAVGVVECLDDEGQCRRDDLETASEPGSADRRLAEESADLPALARTALEVAGALRETGARDPASLDAADRLEKACGPFRTHDDGPGPMDSTSAEQARPDLQPLVPRRSVLVVAPPTSCVRGSWAETVRRAGYAVVATDDEDALPAPESEPTVAIVDLALGERVSDDLHQRLRRAYPGTPILVVSSSSNGAFEARRWRRTNTWYIPRGVDGDELVRLIGDVAPKPVLRTRPER